MSIFYLSFELLLIFLQRVCSAINRMQRKPRVQSELLDGIDVQIFAPPALPQPRTERGYAVLGPHEVYDPESHPSGFYFLQKYNVAVLSGPIFGPQIFREAGASSLSTRI